MYTEAMMAIQWQSAQATFELWPEINPNPAHWLSVWQAFSQNEWSEPVTLRKKKKNLPIFVATVRFHFVSELQDYQLWCSIKKTEPQKDTLNRLLDNTLFSDFTSVRGQLFFTDLNQNNA